jgi:AcrR family transcriptional regulator
MSPSAGSAPPPHAQLARGLLRQRVLDTVGELLCERPWSELTMAQVARRAGASRQTLYNAFGSRQELAQAYIDREADRFLAAVDEAVREHAGNPREALVAALELFLTAAGEHPLVRAIISSEGGRELLPLVTTRGAPLIERASERLTEVLLGTWPRLARTDAAPIADALVRLAISHAASPSEQGSAATARALARILGPHIDQLLG